MDLSEELHLHEKPSNNKILFVNSNEYYRKDCPWNVKKNKTCVIAIAPTAHVLAREFAVNASVIT